MSAVCMCVHACVGTCVCGRVRSPSQGKGKRLRDSPKSVRECIDESSVARQIEVAGWEFTVDQPALLSLLPGSTGRERAERWLIPGVGTHQK